MEVGATKQASLAISALGGARDEACSFEIIETAIEGPHGLHGTAGKQLTAREYGGVGAFGVHGAGESGEQGAGACADAL